MGEQFDRRFQEERHKFKNLSKAVLNTNTSEAGISDIVYKVTGDCVECQLEKQVRPKKITILEEQTDAGDAGAADVVVIATKESVRRRIARWEALETNDHDATIEHTECVFQSDVSCSWDQLKLSDHDLIIEQTDLTLQEEMACFAGSNMST